MVAIYHLQKAHPDAGEFRIWSLLANDTLAVRTVGRVMALNRQVYADIPPPQGASGPRKPPQPHPYQARAAHEFWFIDGRMGESYRTLLETHFSIQRRLYDYQFAQTTPSAEFEQLHQTFMIT